MEVSTSNPFTGSFNIRVIRKYYNEATLRQILIEGADKKPYYDMDLSDRVSIYMNLPIMDLLLHTAKPNTLRLYLHIVYNLLKKGQDFIDLNVADTQKLLQVSKNTMYASIEQLCEFRLLAVRKGRNMYWINSELMFKGNRATYLDDNAPDSLIPVKSESQI